MVIRFRTLRPLDLQQPLPGFQELNPAPFATIRTAQFYANVCVICSLPTLPRRRNRFITTKKWRCDSTQNPQNIYPSLTMHSCLVLVLLVLVISLPSAVCALDDNLANLIKSKLQARAGAASATSQLPPGSYQSSCNSCVYPVDCTWGSNPSDSVRLF